MKNEFSGTTVLAAILDRSGSMAHLIDDMLGGYNTWLAQQQRAEGHATVTTTIFDGVAEIIGKPNVDVLKAKALTRKDYFARGLTALNDAIGKTISAMTVGKHDRALVLIATDGFENASKEWTTEAVKNLITAKEELGNWTFVFLSSSPTAWNDAGVYKMKAGNTVQYAATAGATQSMWSNISAQSMSYRSSNAVKSDIMGGTPVVDPSYNPATTNTVPSGATNGSEK